MNDEHDDAWRERLARASDVRVKTGSDPRWRKFGNASEMGILDGIGWANFCAERGIKPKVVPSEFWALDADGRGDPLAIISCPCGNQPLVKALAAPIECRAEDDCERYFFFDGENVFAFNSPKPESIVADATT
jgi:hypothetical protein